MWDCRAFLLFMAALTGGAVNAATRGSAAMDSARLSDGSDGHDWAAYGRTYGEQHFSPLSQINDGNVANLGLAWSMELGEGSFVTIPLAVHNTLYFASGYSVLHALDAASGRQLWVYDPKVPQVAGHKLRMGWGSRGIGYWNGKLYIGTLDGRLIAVDAASGKPVWSVMTVGEDDARYIVGAPRLFAGKVIIGHAGADYGAVRGYVTTYDAQTGKQLWRFYIVPGNPANGFEDKAMELAAATWSGEWWKYGGGGTVWNAITYDAATDTIFLGTGNGSPWNHRIRSAGKGDNLFLCSIVALNGTTGLYKWHYQVNPAESWDYDASMDMELADLEIAGRMRQVLLTAPKNGFLYVIDRIDGKLISAAPIVRVSWASGIDLKTGRPVEVRGIRYPDNTSFTLWPGTIGAHNWMPMAYSPQTHLIYIPTQVMPVTYSDKGITRENWTRAGGNVLDGALALTAADSTSHDAEIGTSALLAWDPVAQKLAWKVPTPAMWNGGVMATGGRLVFQGHVDGTFNAYAAQTGERLWSFAARAPIIAAPIAYTVADRQYVTVLTGIAGTGAIYGPVNQPNYIDSRKTPRRVLTFVLQGVARLPPYEPGKLQPLDDPDFIPDPERAGRGAKTYAAHCSVCHGFNAISGGFAPELRISPIVRSKEAFATVVRDGRLVAHGMPRFEDLSGADREDLQEFIRAEGRKIARSAIGEEPR